MDREIEFVKDEIKKIEVVDNFRHWREDEYWRATRRSIEETKKIASDNVKWLWSIKARDYRGKKNDKQGNTGNDNTE